MLTAALHDAWPFLRAYLKLPKARELLCEVIDEIQTQAFRSDHLGSLAGVLPKRYRPQEAVRALVAPVSCESWEMATDAFRRGAIPSRDLFKSVCEAYNASPNTFGKKFIAKASSRQNFPWRDYFAFPGYCDYLDLLRRAEANDNRALFVVASSIMKAGEKRAFIAGVRELELLKKCVAHMVLPAQWQSSIPLELRSYYFNGELGL